MEGLTPLQAPLPATTTALPPVAEVDAQAANEDDTSTNEPSYVNMAINNGPGTIARLQYLSHFGSVDSMAISEGTIAGVEEEDTKKRDAPRFKGPSYAATVAAGAIKHVETPIKAFKAEPQQVGVLTRSTKKTHRTGATIITDSELLYYLRIEFMYEPRHNNTPRLMAGKAKKWIRQFDTTNYTTEETYAMISRAVAAAIRIPDEEQKARQFLKDDKSIQEIKKHNSFVNEGTVGKTWLFGKSYQLPTNNSK